MKTKQAGVTANLSLSGNYVVVKTPADIDIAYRMVIWLLHLYGKDPVIPDQQGT